MSSHAVSSDALSCNSPEYENELAAASAGVAFRLQAEFMSTFQTPAAFRVDMDVQDVGDGGRVVIGMATTNLDAAGILITVR